MLLGLFWGPFGRALGLAKIWIFGNLFKIFQNDVKWALGALGGPIFPYFPPLTPLLALCGLIGLLAVCPAHDTV